MHVCACMHVHSVASMWVHCVTSLCACVDTMVQCLTIFLQLPLTFTCDFVSLQTTPRGNGNTPVVAEHAWLSFPQTNKHFIFNGRLMHGVLGSLGGMSRANGNLPGKRITLLINWWTSTPKPPNCVLLDSARLKQYATRSCLARPSRLPLHGVTPSSQTNSNPLSLHHVAHRCTKTHTAAHSGTQRHTGTCACVYGLFVFIGLLCLDFNLHSLL